MPPRSGLSLSRTCQPTHDDLRKMGLPVSPHAGIDPHSSAGRPAYRMVHDPRGASHDDPSNTASADVGIRADRPVSDSMSSSIAGLCPTMARVVTSGAPRTNRRRSRPSKVYAVSLTSTRGWVGNSAATISHVRWARTAGDTSARSGWIPLLLNHFPVAGACRAPRAFRGRWRSGTGTSQSDLACLMRTRVRVLTWPVWWSLARAAKGSRRAG